MQKQNMAPDAEFDSLIAPKVDTVRFFEIDGRTCRIFLTATGTIACEQRSPSGQWTHVPLRKASVIELFDMFVIRRSSSDEQIEAALASYR